MCLSADGAGNWTTDGCTLADFDPDVALVYCKCSHLTNFACLVVSSYVTKVQSPMFSPKLWRVGGGVGRWGRVSGSGNQGKKVEVVPVASYNITLMETGQRGGVLLLLHYTSCFLSSEYRGKNGEPNKFS